ncbi:hypothetical protein [Amphibacillus sediminis]|uniref:hypothetical protein n=1 Tax=Amphibacillus sediminis TaxID=360185 RepID=UPI00082EEC4F|nr:hypothetical protein [Amphibacillus sediminis]
MSLKTIDEVKKIERQAEELERDYQEKLQKMEKETQEKLIELQQQVDRAVEAFTEKEAALKEEKLQALAANYAQKQETELQQLEANFADKKDQLVNAVIEEVMKKYGNS